ncbi:hypothetical protein [Actinomadura madurae]|uniref:hypothetical protein n=1 Tax=Actinomadura madurae TaxID=1993 RepID=UPI0020D20421|nr:hypothetical protein [Actinomadura madurae]MCP9947245.1 hypothetical protein [Actinomadura madurae]MCP9964008.1 hypothetical protein [Actinomadura madurae]MCP9976484.1 hypothetical protein [Actinomadura madurae]MCQ0012023.1 hypothetical protein [Actinomadura madurae]MCQ0012676.1 hypothetical protein [Actinomadura madurae]
MAVKFDERGIERAIAAEIDDLARRYENAVRSMAVELRGWTAEEIKPLVRARWADLGGEITDPELTEIASAISEGAEIHFRRE